MSEIKQILPRMVVNTVMKVFSHRCSLRPVVDFWELYYLMTRDPYKGYLNSFTRDNCELSAAELISIASCVLQIGPTGFHTKSNRQVGECIWKYHADLLSTETVLRSVIHFWGLFGYWDLVSLLLNVASRSIFAYRAAPLHLTMAVSRDSFRGYSSSIRSLAKVFEERLHPRGSFYRITSISNCSLYQYTLAVVRVCRSGLSVAANLQLCLMHISEALLLRIEARGIGLSLLVDSMELFSGVYPCPMNERLLITIQSVLIENGNYTMLTKDEISIILKIMSLVSARNLVLMEMLSLRVFPCVSHPWSVVSATKESYVESGPETNCSVVDNHRINVRIRGETNVSQRILIAMKDSYAYISPELSHNLSCRALKIKSCQMTPPEVADLMSAIAHLPAGLECSLSLGVYIKNYITYSNMCEMTLPQLSAIFAALTCHLDTSNLPCLPDRCACVHDTSRIKPKSHFWPRLQSQNSRKIRPSVPIFSINYHSFCLRVVTKAYRRLFPGGARSSLRRRKPNIEILPQLVSLNQANSPIRRCPLSVQRGFFQDALDVSRTERLCTCHCHESLGSSNVFNEAMLSCVSVITKASLDCFDSLGLLHPVTHFIKEGCLPAGHSKIWRSTPLLVLIQSIQDIILGLQLLFLHRKVQHKSYENSYRNYNPKLVISTLGVEELQNLILIVEKMLLISASSPRTESIQMAIKTGNSSSYRQSRKEIRDLEAQVVSTLGRYLSSGGSGSSTYRMLARPTIHNLDATILLESFTMV